MAYGFVWVAPSPWPSPARGEGQGEGEYKTCERSEDHNSKLNTSNSKRL